MLDPRLGSLVDRNWIVGWRMAARCGRSGSFLCRGRIELRLARGAIVAAPGARCLIGIPLVNVMPRDATTAIRVGDGGTLALDGALIGRGASLGVGPHARLAIGPRSSLADGSRIAAGRSVAIGRDCAISFGVTILDDDGHGFGPPPYSAPIVIEDRVWIGCNVTILKGVTIGAGSVVAAGAVVTRSSPPASLLAGVPARVVREGVQWTDAARLSRSHDR